MNRSLNHWDQFQRISITGGEGVLHRNWADALRGHEGMLRQLDEKPGRLLRKGGGQGETRLVEIDGRTLFTKTYKADRFARWAKDFFGSFRCRREWQANVIAEEAGVACAAVAGYIVRRKGLRVEQMFFTEAAPGRSSYEIISDLKGDPGRLHEFVATLARYCAALRSRGFCHAHLNTKHIFTDDERNFVLIDLESSRFSKPDSAATTQKARDKFIRNLSRYVSEEEIRHFRAVHEEEFARLRRGG